METTAEKQMKFESTEHNAQEYYWQIGTCMWKQNSNNSSCSVDVTSLESKC